MIVGIVKERFPHERRVALTPAAVESLIKSGNTCFVETGAGDAVRFFDDQYRAVGATVVYTPEEVIRRAEILVKVLPPSQAEYSLLEEGQILMSFLLLGIAKRSFIDHLLTKKIATVGNELIEFPAGVGPILRSMSEIAGILAVQMAALYLGSNYSGRGILICGLPGVAPAEVVILGAGAAGLSAARTACALGAHVILMDKEIGKLREAELHLGRSLTTVIASPENIRRGVMRADVLIGGISVSDDESHHLIKEELVKTMKSGSVIVDLSIDQGGCVETSRPTSIPDPVFVKHGVTHYCVPNMPSIVARTSTYALTNGILPFLSSICAYGLEEALRVDEGLRSGVVTYKGHATHRKLEEFFNLSIADLSAFESTHISH